MPDTAGSSTFGRLKAFVSREQQAERPCCVLAARLHEPGGSSGRLFDQTCALFGRLFYETFTPETAIIEATPFFLALISGDHKDEVERALPNIRADLERHLATVPQIDYAVFGPDEIRQLVVPDRSKEISPC